MYQQKKKKIGMNDLDKLVATVEAYLQKQKNADVNVTRSLCMVIAKVFMKMSGGLDSESNFTQSVVNLNSSLKKIDSSELFTILTSKLNEPETEEQRKGDEKLDKCIETHQDSESKNNKPAMEAKSVFRKRKKFVVANVEPLPNKKFKSPLLENDDEEDGEEGIGATIMFNRKLAPKQTFPNPAQNSAEAPSESSQNDILQLESEISNLKQKVQQCLSTANKHFQNSKGSTSYIENEHYKLTPVSLKERLQLVPPFLQTLNEQYMPVNAINASQKNDTNYLLDIIMGSLLPSSASADGSHTDLIEGKIEISNDENGELTQSCNKSSKMLIEYKKVIEQKKHVKNIVLNDTLQSVTKQDQNSSVQKEDVVDDDEAINTDEDEEEEKDSKDKSESPRFIDNSHTLPVYACKQDFLKVLQENQVVLVIGETGSGKTTQLPKYIYEQDREAHKIAITQPRRVAAMSIAQRISDEMQCELGKEVGYAVRFDDKTDKNLTRIKVMTDGILLRDFLTMSSSSQIDYTHIIIDEAHERSLNTDVLLGFIKQLLLLKQNRLLKIIITSATINFKTFLQHFPNAPLFKIPGKTFPVQSIYLKRPAMDYIETIIQSIVKLHLSKPVDENNDVLCFMTGQDDIEISCAMLEDKLTQVYAQALTETPTTTTEQETKNFVILPLYSTLSPKKQALVFQKFPGKRKIIFCTNIAETSITIDGIKFVVDAGFHKLKLYNSKIGLNILKTVPISKDMSVQRQGRAGRTQPGVVYKMYTESCFNFELLKNSIPEIKRTNLSNVLLMLLSAQEGSSNLEGNHNSIDKILKFPFMEKPSKLTLLSSFLELYNLQAVDNTGNLTSLGFKMSRVPIPPNLSKMLILSKQPTFDCFDEILIIVGMLSIESNSGAGYFQRPKNFEKLADSKRLNFIVPYSDHLTLLNLYSKWQYNNCSMKWCERNFINHRALLKVEKIVEQLKRIANGIGVGTSKSNKNVNLTHHKNTWENVKKCVTTGYSYKNIGKKIGLNKYISLQNGMTLQIHPTSSLFGLPDLPPYIIYHDLLLTSKEYINCVTAVDPVWIMEYQPFYFNIHAAVNEENGQVMHQTNDLEQLEALQNLRKHSINLLEKQKNLALMKDQFAKEKRTMAAQQEEQAYMSNMGSLKTFKRRKKMGL